MNCISKLFRKLFFKNKDSKQLRIVKERLEILDALVIVHNNFEEFNKMKITSKNLVADMKAKFGIHEPPASVILGIKKPINQISLESILDEKKDLQAQQNTLENILN